MKQSLVAIVVLLLSVPGGAADNGDSVAGSLDGTYSNGFSEYTFTPQGKVITDGGIGKIELDYEVADGNVRIKTPMGTLLMPILDDGAAISGPGGEKLIKRSALASHGPDSPSADDVGAALAQRVQDVFFDCPFLQYHDITIGDSSTKDSDPDIHKVVTSYNVQLFVYGHDLDEVRDDYQTRQGLPDWFPPACEALADGSVKASDAADRVVELEFERASTEATVDEAVFKGFFTGVSALHVSEATLYLRQDEKGWQIVEE